MRTLLALGATMLLACGDGSDLVKDAGGESRAPAGFIERRTTLDDGKVIIEKVVYRSQGLRIYGQLCRPAGAGRHPLIVNNHGGFEGLGNDWNGGACRDQANQGFVAVQSAYRGEDGSQGAIEVCRGEVDDVLELLAITRTEPYVDPTRVVMLGASHGGCITLQALARGAEVRAAVALVPPTDFVAAHAFWSNSLAAGRGTPEQNATWTALIDRVERSTGGTPEQEPDAYRARSPLASAQAVATSPAQLLVIGAGDDWLVPASQTCALAASDTTFEAYHVDTSGVVVQQSPPGCAGEKVSWRPGPRPSAWPAQRYAFVYDGTGHGLEGATGSLALQDFVAFLLPQLVY